MLESPRKQRPEDLLRRVSGADPASLSELVQQSGPIVAALIGRLNGEWITEDELGH